MAGEWPPSWKRARLGEVADVNWGDTSVTKASYVDSGSLAFSASGPDGFLPYADFDRVGVVVSAIGADCGKTWLAKGKWSCIKNTLRFWATSPDVDSAFLYWLTIDPAIWPKRGSAQPFISQGDARLLEIAYPPLLEQRAIAHILGTLDDKIELNRRMNETLEQVARALFKSWFVDFDPVRAKAEGRDPGLPSEITDLFPDSFEESELGEIPKEWDVVQLRELTDTVKGRSYKSEELVDSDTALVTLKSFARGGGYRPDGLKPFTGTYKPEQVVEPGELVIACTDVTQAAEVIGRPAVVRGTAGYRTLVASLDTMVVRPRHPSMTRAFLYFLGRTDAFVAHTYAHTTGTTVLHLAKEAVPSFKFALPKAQLVEAFDSIASRALNRIQATEEESGTLAALRDALLPKLISGELRVKNPGDFIETRS
jgi:type I restriction enzyme S subunit